MIKIEAKDFWIYMIIGGLCLLILAITHEAAQHIEALHEYYNKEMIRLNCNPRQTTIDTPINITFNLTGGPTWKP